MLKSYYEILGVNQNATKSEIKAKFKKLVKMYHPDLNPSVEAEEIFKEINRAAEVLLDDEKRQRYDSLRNDFNLNYKNSFTNYSKYNQYKNNKDRSNYSFSDLFRKSQNKSENDKIFNAKNLKPIKGDDIEINVEIDYQEALLGTQRSVNISSASVCPKCFGRKYANGHKCEYCNGLGEKVENRKITVKIPKGLKNGTKLRIKGEGKEGKNGGDKGNLYVIVKIHNKEKLIVKDNVVYSESYISPYTAVLGGNVPVETLWGQAFIKIPPLTKSYQSFKLVDVGTFDEKNNKKGEQVVKIIIQIPESLTNEEIQLYEKLKEINLKKKNANTIYE